MYKAPRPKLNAHLNPDEFEICVPQSCKLFGQVWTDGDVWYEYLRTLCDGRPRRTRVTARQGEEEALAKCELDPTCPPRKACVDLFGIPSWQLQGRFALRHALAVHKKLFLQFLRQPGVDAGDVGFAFLEQEHRFANRLALRLHMPKKRHLPISTSSETSAGSAIPRDLSSPLYLLKDSDFCEEPPRQDLVNKIAAVLFVTVEVLKDEVASGRWQHYPIGMVAREDLSYTCPTKGDDLKCRLSVCGVPVDIVGRTYFPANHHPGGGRRGVFADPPKTSVELSDAELLLTGRNRVNPLAGGVSVGSRTGQAGTLGAIVWDRTDGEPCILSNWHVLAGSAAATVGQPCYQPALFDGGTEADTVGYLKRWHIGVEGDVAIAELSGDRNYAAADILGMWNPIAGTRRPKLNMGIRKWGRTTGFTEGFIDGLGLAVNLDYGSGVIRHFQDQFHIAPLFHGDTVSSVGDSGSLVLTYVDLDEEERTLKECKLELELCQQDLKPIREILAKLCTYLPLFELLCTILPKADWRSPATVGDALKKALGPKAPAKDVVSEFCRCLPTLRKLCKAQKDVPKSSAAAGTSLLPKDQEKANPQTAPPGRNDANEGLMVSLKISDSQLDAIEEFLESIGFDLADGKARVVDQGNRGRRQVYFAVGMIFAGDTPGSPLGEFALASGIRQLAKQLHFSLRPVFEPRSSFRRLRTELQEVETRVSPSRRTVAPRGLADDNRPGAPQPDFEPLQNEPGG